MLKVRSGAMQGQESIAIGVQDNGSGAEGLLFVASRRPVVLSQRRRSNFSTRNCSNCRSTEDLTADHIFPKFKCGRNVLSNVQVLCRSCNSGKREGGRDRLEASSQRNPPPGFREKQRGWSPAPG